MEQWPARNRFLKYRVGFVILGVFALMSADVRAESVSSSAANANSVSSKRDPNFRLLAERDARGVNIPIWDRNAKGWRVKNLRPKFFTQAAATEYASIAANLSKDVRDCELSRFKGRLRDYRDRLQKKSARTWRKHALVEKTLRVLWGRSPKPTKRIRLLENEMDDISRQARDVDKIVSILNGQTYAAARNFKKGSQFEGCTKQGHRKTPALHWAALSRPPGPKTKVRRYYWVRAHMVADWAGRDTDCTKGDKPIARLCGSGTLGTVAVCWKGRGTGHPFAKCKGFSTWCTYKSVTVKTVPDAKAYGTVYECRKLRKP